MINIRAILLFSCSLLFVSCVSHEVLFEGKSVINTHGSVHRTGSMVIMLAGERKTEQDSLKLLEHYLETFIPPDEERFAPSFEFEDSLLIVTWDGDIPFGETPFTDYSHHIGDGPTAENRVTIGMKSRWFYEDYSYLEIYSDPVDTLTIYPMLQSKMSAASAGIMTRPELRKIKDGQRAEDLLAGLETKVGIEILRRFIASPGSTDSLTAEMETLIAAAAVNLSGLAGAAGNSDLLNNMMKTVYDAVWDTIMSANPGIFGSYGLGEEGDHRFRIEAVFPGCTIRTNADSSLEGRSIWNFGQLDFFGREYRLEVVSRRWVWHNVAIAATGLFLILLIALGPIRRVGGLPAGERR